MKKMIHFLLLPPFLLFLSCSSEIPKGKALHSPGLYEGQLNPVYWIKNTKGANDLIMDTKSIQVYNDKALKNNPVMHDLQNYPSSLTQKEVVDTINSLSSPSSTPRYDKNGTPINYSVLLNNLNISSVPSNVTPRYGITVRRTEMRTFPSYQKAYKNPKIPEDLDIDRFIETAVYAVEPIVILHESNDKEWYFASMFNYTAWIPKKDIALTTKEELFTYLNKQDFIIVTANRLMTVYDPINTETSNMVLERGIRIPLADESSFEKNNINDQSQIGSFVTQFPIKDTNGQLKFRDILISKTAGVNKGYIPYTRANIIEGAFTMLGERYGWGGDYNGRDCTAFIMDVFRPFGLLISRNSGEQGKKTTGIIHKIETNVSTDDRFKMLDSMPVGSTFYLLGHAGIYLGKADGNYYIIHDTMGYQVKEGDTFTDFNIRSVTVSALKTTYLNEKPYPDSFYSMVEFRN